MHRTPFAWLFTLALLFAPTTLFAWQWGHGSYGGGGAFVNPTSQPRQAKATVNGENVELEHVASMPVYETAVKEVKEAREKIVDGEKVVEEVVVPVTYTVAKMVSVKDVYKVSLKETEFFDMEGKPVDPAKVAARLKMGPTVLFAHRQVPPYYLTVFKPDTLFLVVPMQFDLPGTFIPAPGLEGPDEAPAEGPAPRPEPATPAVPAPGAGPEEGPGVEPSVVLAKATKDLVTLRSYVKEKSSETALIEEPDEKGAKRKVPISIEVETIVDVEKRYPHKALKAQRADGKAVTTAELNKLLAASRCVLVSGDGEKVAPSFLEIVKPDALILIPPVAEPPVMSAPVPVGPPGVVPAPAPMDE